MRVNSEGVSASRVYLPADQAHANLLSFFVMQFPHIAREEWVSRFNEGLIQLKDVVYFLTFIGFTLFLTHRVVESNRWR